MTSALKKKLSITCTLNGKRVRVKAYPMTRLLDLIREDLKLTGTKEGCGEGECGACSVIMDGQLVNSCLIPAAQLNGATLQTIEGLTKNRNMRELQNSFVACGGAQCGICTPGMLMATAHILKTQKKISRKTLQEGLAGNLCRCTGYMKIFESILNACRRFKPS